MFASTRDQRRQLARDNAKVPRTLTLQPRSSWSASMLAEPKLIEAWRSRDFFLQAFQEDAGIIRLTICRTTVSGATWEGGITWDDLQRLKRECGRGSLCAVEIYPGDRDLVDVANMRHLWVMPEPPAFAWRRGE